jgi:hypothetical protein
MPARLRQLNGGLASADAALSIAQAEVRTAPKLDKEAAKLAIWWELANFPNKAMEETKATLAKYTTKITLRIGKPTEFERKRQRKPSVRAMNLVMK